MTSTSVVKTLAAEVTAREAAARAQSNWRRSYDRTVEHVHAPDRASLLEMKVSDLESALEAMTREAEATAVKMRAADAAAQVARDEAAVARAAEVEARQQLAMVGSGNMHSGVRGPLVDVQCQTEEEVQTVFAEGTECSERRDSSHSLPEAVEGPHPPVETRRRTARSKWDEMLAATNSQQRALHDDEREFLDDIESCCRAAVRLTTAGRALQETRSEQNIWCSPDSELQRLFECLEDARVAISNLNYCLLRLVEKFQVERHLTLLALPEDVEKLVAFLREHLMVNDGSLVTSTKWGSIPKCMRLRRIRGEVPPAWVTVESLAQGNRSQLKDGDQLTFARRAPPDFIEHLRHLKVLLTNAVGAGRLACEVISIQGPPYSSENTRRRCLVRAWEARLHVEVEFHVFECGVWEDFDLASQGYKEEVMVQRRVAMEPPREQRGGGEGVNTQEGKTDKGQGKGPGKGPGKGKGGSMPVPPRKGGERSPSATFVSARGAGDGDTSRRSVVEAMEGRMQSKLFGDLTRVPSKQMLDHVNREFPTYLSEIERSAHELASLREAFGGRGALLIHACISSQAPGQKSKQEKPKEKLTKKQVIKGKMGPVGDLRRFDQTLRFKDLPPCNPERLVGESGLRCPPKDEPSWITHKVARIFASLDFDGLPLLGKAVEKVLPAELEVPTTSGQREEVTQKIEQAFCAPHEAVELLEELNEGHADLLDTLELQLLPFAYIPRLADKVLLFRINSACGEVEQEAQTEYARVTNACWSIVKSDPLRDLLRVMLQMAAYVANFGDTENADRRGFELRRITQYEDFSLGRHSFLSVLCTFLMNLRPAGLKKKKNSKEPCNERTFVDTLLSDLQGARSVLDKEISREVLAQYQGRVAGMRGIVERSVLEEAQLFDPPKVGRSVTDTERFEELVAWTQGRKHLEHLHDRLQDLEELLERLSCDLTKSETELKQYSALRPQDFETTTYLDIFKALFSFLDRFQARWIQLQQKPAEIDDLLRVILAAEELQVLFESDCRTAAFQNWREKVSKKRPPAWNASVKEQALRRLFRLFDPDGSGFVDAAEVDLTFRAFGIAVPQEKELHVELVKNFDEDQDGCMTFDEFCSMVATRISWAFSRFTEGNSVTFITLDDLHRAAERGGVVISDAELVSMISILDASESRARRISLPEFEQIIFMRTEGRLDVTSVGERQIQLLRGSSIDFWLMHDDDALEAGRHFSGLESPINRGW